MGKALRNRYHRCMRRFWMAAYRVEAWRLRKTPHSMKHLDLRCLLKATIHALKIREGQRVR